MPDAPLDLGAGNLVFAEQIKKEMGPRWISSRHQMHLTDYTSPFNGHASPGVRGCFDPYYDETKPWWSKPKMPSFVTSGCFDASKLHLGQKAVIPLWKTATKSIVDPSATSRHATPAQTPGSRPGTTALTCHEATASPVALVTSRSSPALHTGKQVIAKQPSSQALAKESWKVQAAVKHEVKRACKKAGVFEQLQNHVR
eukprot:gnl/MRDRNA2_/MRDRNA2_34988_c0_seq1.p1 gnl/MRDRNA2_/MRDRNA2_34988_c0~~gnl/MRDRNA2_/MRDRNA2_34988_c0_seq1.p1  ORF type:complete len:199 (+),score=33.29 gnl/MRDRNA2_/MRDRNA2_34988_c0_seq1:116-712(+)